MPFTFSHPAFILPLTKVNKKLFSVTGLAAGSIAPDLEFLLQLKEVPCFGHGWPGIILLDMPLALMLGFLFHELIRNVLIFNLPQNLQQRFTAFLPFDFRQYFLQHKVIFLVSALLGILSHVFTDAFTHSDGFFVNMHSFFFRQVNILGYVFRVYYILQLLTSLAGALYIMVHILKMKQQRSLHRYDKPAVYWVSIILLTACIFILRLLLRKATESFADIIIAGIGSFLYALIIISVYYFKKEKAANAKPPGKIPGGL